MSENNKPGLPAAINRRRFLGTIGAAAGALAFSNLTSCSSASKDKRPNIVYIFTDQQTAGAMSCTGNTYLKTPAVDQLAANGVRFDRAYCTSPLCAPSRASMMTGRLPHETGVVRNKNKGIKEQLRQQEMGWLFKKAGYKCVYAGKWHLRTNQNVDPGHGFENISPFYDGQVTEACIKFLRQKQDKPFLLVASYKNPHDICGWRAAGEKMLKRGLNFYRKLSKRKDAALKELITQCPPLPENFAVPAMEPEHANKVRYSMSKAHKDWSEEVWRIYRWVYYRYVEIIDKEIGRVLQTLKESGLTGNTLVIFSSDHGEGGGSHNWAAKSNFYEESVRIPFVFSYEGRSQKGKVDAHLILNGLDLLPTMCDYAGIKIPEGLYGRNLRPLIEGQKVDSWRDEIISQMVHSRMLRTDRYKYIVYRKGKNREQLIDLKKDPGENVNLASNADYRDILENLRNRLLVWCDKTNDETGKKIIKGE